MAAQLAQIALCTTDMPRSVQLYSEGFGFVEAGGRVLWGERVARIQGLGDDAAFTLWWLVGRQDLVQLELFHHTTPPQRAVADRAPNMSNVTVLVNGERRKVKPANPKNGKPMRELGGAS